MKGIYKIKTLHNNKIYIGSSIRNIEERYYYHKSLLKRQKHHSPYLQNVYNKYGLDNFEFSLIEEFQDNNKEILIQKEQFWINYFKAYIPKFGYNVSKVAQCNTKLRYIYQYNIKGDFIKKWESVIDASYYLNISKNSIYYSLKNKSICKKGFRWSNKLENLENLERVISCYNDKGYIVKNFKNAVEATKYVNSKLVPNLFRSIKMNFKFKDYYWREYIKESPLEFINIDKNKNKLNKKIKCILFNNEIQYFNSITEASKYFNVYISSISRVLKSKGRLKGLKFEYVEPLQSNL